MDAQIVRRGEIYYCDCGIHKGSEESGIRPVLIVQNDKGNYYSKTVIVIPLTSQIKKLYMPTHILIYPESSGLKVKSMILAEQVMTVDKSRLLTYVGTIDAGILNKVDYALGVSVGLERQVLVRWNRRHYRMNFRKKD